MRISSGPLFILTIVLISFPITASADVLLNQPAEEYRLKGYVEQKKGNLPEALTYYLKALSLGLKQATIYNDVGVVYEQLELSDKAEESYLTAIQTDPNYLPPYTNLAFLYKEKGDRARAIQYFEDRLWRAADDDPWREKVKKELYTLDPSLREKVLQQEARELNEQLQRKALEEFSLEIERAEGHYQRGLSFSKEQKFQDAMAEFDRALAVTPGNPKVIAARAQAEREQQLTELRKQARAALETLDAGNLEAARSEFQNILADIPATADSASGSN